MKKISKTILSVVILTVVLAGTYFTNCMDNNNTDYYEFQESSDELVIGKIYAEEHDMPTTGWSTANWGLGFIYDIKGTLSPLDYNRENVVAVTSEEDGIVDGYSLTSPCVIWPTNAYTQTYLVGGCTVVFETGKEYVIAESHATELGWQVTFDTTDTLSEETCGDIYNVTIIDQVGANVPTCMFASYNTQFGLQGRVMAWLSKLIGYRGYTRPMSLLCCIAMAMAVVACAYLLAKKYNKLFAGVFFVVFWLSPWIVNFAKSVYWVEFTWLLPFIAGTIVAIWIDNKRVRRCGYLMVFLAVLIKSLCGYEYITFVMLGSIWILVMDLLTAIVRKDKQKALQVFCTTFIVGIVALAGFAVALIMHAWIRGIGDILAGLKTIYEQDVLRRTLGGDASNFGLDISDSLNASILDVLKLYFSFSTQIITGMDGNLFPLLILLPIAIIAWKLHKKEDCTQEILLYVTSFVIAISWFVLGKSHSYIHTFMNFVCWYYWFIPVCFYIIVKQIVDFVTVRKNVQLEEKA